jgi:hypothetical protein
VTGIFFKNTPAAVAMIQVIESPSVAQLTLGLLLTSE